MSAFLSNWPDVDFFFLQWLQFFLGKKVGGIFQNGHAILKNGFLLANLSCDHFSGVGVGV